VTDVSNTSYDVDLPGLRRHRLERALGEMERDGLDAVVLGREANARYVSDVRRLWTVGARPFSPGCVVVRRNATVHLLSTWHDGIPEEIPRQNLYRTTWNPEYLISALQGIDGLRDARRIGIDGMTPRLAALLSAALPNAEWVDAMPALLRARVHKSAAEVACIRNATALTARALAAMIDEVRPGTIERVLVGRFSEEAARLGMTIPAFEASFCASPRHSRFGNAPLPRFMSAYRPLSAGDLVTCHAGVLYAGYEGAVGNTIRCADDGSTPEPVLEHRLDRLRGALRSACRPGTRLADVVAAYDACGEPRPDTFGFPILHGVGLGTEPPLTREARLDVDMVVTVYAYVSSAGIGGCFARDTLHIVRDGCEYLGAAPPLAST
jgi:Xaa-Pro dipeptidase